MSFPTSVRKTDDCGEKSSAAYQVHCSTKCTHILLLLKIFSSFPLQPTTPWCLVSASRHHGSAFSDCLHVDGCRDYARHFRFCTTDRSVSFCLCRCVYLFLSVGVVDLGGSDNVNHIQIERTLLSASGQYFASTMVIVGMSVVATVIVLQFHHHNPDSGHMPRWVSWILPAYLLFENVHLCSFSYQRLSVSDRCTWFCCSGSLGSCG